MSYKLIAIDIDDTLLTSEKTISAKNKEMITKALDQNIKVVLCSGRPHQAMIKYATALGLQGTNQYMITNGGAIIEDMTGKIIHQSTLSNDFYHQFVQFINKNHLSYCVFDANGNMYTGNNNLINKFTIDMAFENNSGLYIRQPDELPEDFEITKAVINDNQYRLNNVTEMVTNEFKNYFVVRTGVGYLEIFPKTVNKGNAVKYLANSLNIDLKDVITFGDRDNDIPMLKIAGKGVAMENATAGAKKASDYITTDNNHDGVGNAIEKLIF